MFLLGQKFHATTLTLWAVLRVAETIESHSGYSLPMPVSVLMGNFFRVIPTFVGTDPDYHDFHHSHNVGNYSSFFSIWDDLFETNS